MGILDTVKSTLRDANESLASAQKSWRDDNLNAKAASLVEREKSIADRELHARTREKDLERREGRIGRRRLKYGLVCAMIGIGAYGLGILAGQSRINSPGEDAGKAPVAPPVAAKLPEANLVDEEGATAPPEAIPVPSDPRASYELLSWGVLRNGNRQSFTVRRGPSGTEYSRREIDCSAMTFRYLGTGGTEADAKLERPDPELTELLDGSISYYVAEFVCAK